MGNELFFLRVHSSVRSIVPARPSTSSQTPTSRLMRFAHVAIHEGLKHWEKRVGAAATTASPQAAAATATAVPSK